MENATKALIIAAAILIAIVLISLGVYVLSIGTDAISGADMTEQEISTFNAKFTSYAGENVMGSKVNALLSAIATNNTTEGENGKQIKVTCSELSLSGQAITPGTTTYKVSTGKAYKVEFTQNTSALIDAVTITAK